MNKELLEEAKGLLAENINLHDTIEDMEEQLELLTRCVTLEHENTDLRNEVAAAKETARFWHTKYESLKDDHILAKVLGCGPDQNDIFYHLKRLVKNAEECRKDTVSRQILSDLVAEWRANTAQHPMACADELEELLK